MADVIKLTVNLPQDAFQELEELARDNSETKTQALKNAIAMLAFLNRETANGSRILIEREEEDPRELVFSGFKHARVPAKRKRARVRAAQSGTRVPVAQS